MRTCMSNHLPNQRYTGIIVPVINKYLLQGNVGSLEHFPHQIQYMAVLCIYQTMSAYPLNWTNAPIMGKGGIFLIVGLEKINQPIACRIAEACKCDQGLVIPR